LLFEKIRRQNYKKFPEPPKEPESAAANGGAILQMLSRNPSFAFSFLGKNAYFCKLN